MIPEHFKRRHCGFMAEELEFILNYDIKCRLGGNTGEQEN